MCSVPVLALRTPSAGRGDVERDEGKGDASGVEVEDVLEEGLSVV